MADSTVLLLGASGGFGAAVAAETLARGGRLRVLARDPARTRALHPGAEIIAGDVRDADAVARAATGATAICHAVNLPYHQWDPGMRGITESIARAAEATGATLIFPGNVYGLGRQVDRPLPEGTAMRADTRKGRFRVALEERLRQASAKTRVIIVRAGDFFGPTVRNGLVDRMFANAKAGRAMQAMGRLDVPHQWCYVPDMARLALDLLAIQDRLERLEVVHVAGHVVARQRDFLDHVARVAGHPALRASTLPWWLFSVLGVFNPVMRELVELRYLFDEAVILDDPRRRALLPDFAFTPLDRAIAVTLASY